jgi:phage/plasmid-like protein (TIGR03299 family)
MAHEIHINATTGQASMAYVGNVPWHTLGQLMLEGQDSAAWSQAAGFDFQLLGAPVLMQLPDGETAMVPGQTAIYRSDTLEPMSIMGEGYCVHQPSEILEFFFQVSEKADLRLETAGVLRGGRQYWAMARRGENATIVGDQYADYVLLATSADGTLATTGKHTMTRVVCANTMAVALGERKDSAVRMRHTRAFDAGAMAEALGVADFDAEVRDYAETMERLADYKVSPENARLLFAELLRPGLLSAAGREEKVTIAEAEVEPGQELDFGALLTRPARIEPVRLVVDSAGKVGSEGRAIRGFSDLLTCYESAPGACPGTGYGVLQAVTRWVDHDRGGDDDRLASAWFGQGAALKSRTVETLQAAINGEFRVL